MGVYACPSDLNKLNQHIGVAKGHAFVLPRARSGTWMSYETRLFEPAASGGAGADAPEIRFSSVCWRKCECVRHSQCFTIRSLGSGVAAALTAELSML